MSNEAKTPNGDSNEIQVVEVDEVDYSEYGTAYSDWEFAGAYYSLDSKNKIKYSKYSKGMGTKTIIKLLSDFQVINLKIASKEDTPKVKSGKNIELEAKENKADKKEKTQNSDVTKKAAKATKTTTKKVAKTKTTKTTKSSQTKEDR